MSRYPLSLPTQLKQAAEDLAQRQGVSLNQFILWAVAEKVGALREDLGDPAYPRIAYRRGREGRPMPVLRGTGVRVQTLAVAATRWGLTPAEIAREFELPEPAIREALAFYSAHVDEVEAFITQDEATEVDA